MVENQEQSKPKEREIPVFTVLKNNCILKNIFVLDSPPPISSSSSAEIADQESEREEILLVGRHPDCNIKLEHPSISRFHLRILSKPSSRSLFVTDLSSVHGTYISGKRIEAGVMMELAQGDTLKLGESSRLYRLDWVPMSSAYELNDPFVPQLESLDTVDDEKEEMADQDENSLPRVSAEIDVLGWRFSEEDLDLSMQEMTAKEAPMLEDFCHSYQEKDKQENIRLPENEFPGSQLCPFDALFTSDEVTYQDGDSLIRRNYGHDLGDSMEDLEHLFVHEDQALSMQKMSATSPPQLEEDLELPFVNENLAFSLQNMSAASPPQSLEDLEHTLVDENLAFVMQKMSSALPTQPEDEVEIVNSSEISVKMNDVDSIPQHGDAVKIVSSPEICEKENELSGSQLIEMANITPQINIISPAVLQKASDAEIMEDIEMNSEKRLCMNIWSRRGKSEGVKVRTSKSKAMCPRINMSMQVKSLLGENGLNISILKDQFASPDKDAEIFTPDKENTSPDSCLVRSLGSKFDKALMSESISNTPVSTVNEDEEVFTSDKENMTPNGHLCMSIKKIGSSQEIRHRNSPLKTASLIYPEELILQERKYTSSASKSQCTLKKQPYASKAAKREPFLPLSLVSTSDDKPALHECTVKSESPKAEVWNQPRRNTTELSEKRWIIIVDTACLLNRKSRSELQLLRGLRGTSLVIPRIVLRELDCMARQASFLSRMMEASAALQWIEECVVKRASFLSGMTGASAALQWIEECMASTTWWIHVQSSEEESRLVPPTPPAASAHWFNEDKGAFSVGSIPFSPYTLQEIVTPTATDHVLDSALFFKQTMNGQLVLLSDDVTLKIKAMAEGVICETAKEFRASLVNPFSTRFLYSNSSPRGHTWTCEDDTVLKERLYPSPSRKATRSGEGGAKGLKLILMHNSNFRQMRT